MEQGRREGEDAMVTLERLIEEARRGAISVGDGEYAVSAHDCHNSHHSTFTLTLTRTLTVTLTR